MATYCTPEDVLDVLRLPPGDVDVVRIERAVAVGAELIDKYLDADPLVPVVWTAAELVVLEQANVMLGVEEYRRPGAALGIVDGGWSDLGPFRAGADHLAGVAGLLGPLRRRYGVA